MLQQAYEGVNGSAEIQYDVLKAICGDVSNSFMLDLGCGNAPITRKLGFQNRIYLDIVERDLGEEHLHFKKIDIIDLIKHDSEVFTSTVTISLDNIEHFWEEDAYRIIAWMERNSNKQVIFTPVGLYMNVEDASNNDPDTHKSGWYPQMLPSYACLVFPNFHPTLSEKGLGAFFAFKCDNLKAEFDRVIYELKDKIWVK